MLVGLISDTHAVLHAEVERVFRNVDHIIHAGDIGSENVVRELERLAPMTAISGNADTPPLSDLPQQRAVQLGGVSILIVHHAFERGQPTEALTRGLLRYQPAVAVFGHSHVASVELQDEVLFVNPGGGGRKRFRLPRSVALLTLDSGTPQARLVFLDREPGVGDGA